MEAIIIGVPCRGKTTLVNRLREEDNKIQVMDLGSLRNSLGIHTPHKGFDIEVAHSDLEPYYKVIRTMLKYKRKDYVIEGYGLSPRKALRYARDYNIPCIMLAHKDADIEDELFLSSEYDDENKWTQHRTEEYKRELFAFYKSVEEKWIKQMPKERVFYTDTDFNKAMDCAFHYLTNEYVRLKELERA